jgi:FimV-like protein
MSDFINLDAKAPATLEAVVLAITRLSALTEDQISEIVSSGNLSEYFPFRPSQMEGEIEDSVDEADLVEASPLPLSRRDYGRLVQSSMPSRKAGRALAAGERDRVNVSRTSAESLTMSVVGSKLDLARAYMDMGDPEGARRILDEIVREGSDSREKETLPSKKQHSES